MRTKTLFIAAAALAAGLASSMAQGSNVYSVNIVGWINVPIAANAQNMLATPLDSGTNTVGSLGAGWSNGTVVQVFNGAGFNAAQKIAGSWGTSGTNLISPGTGFYVKGTKAQTLTFIGSAPTTNNYVLPAKTQVLIGSIIPFSGVITDAGANSLNLGPSMPNGTVVQVYNGTGFTANQKILGSWGASPLSVGVAQGMFVKPGGNNPATWVQFMQ